jgi:drug/metabolite transporter (DMT)-like permease
VERVTTVEITKPAPARTASWLPAFATLGAIWGSSFLFIKVGVTELHPTYVTLGRVLAGALTLVIVLVATRDRLPRDAKLWLHLSALAAVVNAVPFTLFGYGEQHISSILAGIWNGTTPLVTLLVVIAFLPQERPDVARVVGLLVGFVGVLTVLGVWRGHAVTGKPGELLGQLLCFGAAVCYGFGFPYLRRVTYGRTESGVSIAAAQLIIATVQLAIVAPILAGPPPAPTSLSAPVVGSVLALGVLGTGIAFVLNYRVIRIAGATTASTVTYLIPVFAAVIGVLVLRESLTWYQPVGALIVLLGVAISQRVFTRARPPR